jgi:hypothetical protein
MIETSPNPELEAVAGPKFADVIGLTGAKEAIIGRLLSADQAFADRVLHEYSANLAEFHAADAATERELLAKAVVRDGKFGKILQEYISQSITGKFFEGVDFKLHPAKDWNEFLSPFAAAGGIFGTVDGKNLILPGAPSGLSALLGTGAEAQALSQIPPQGATLVLPRDPDGRSGITGRFLSAYEDFLAKQKPAIAVDYMAPNEVTEAAPANTVRIVLADPGMPRADFDRIKSFGAIWASPDLYKPSTTT